MGLIGMVSGCFGRPSHTNTTAETKSPANPTALPVDPELKQMVMLAREQARDMFQKRLQACRQQYVPSPARRPHEKTPPHPKPRKAPQVAKARVAKAPSDSYSSFSKSWEEIGRDNRRQFDRAAWQTEQLRIANLIIPAVGGVNYHQALIVSTATPTFI